jgi:hypothetical protein
MNNIKNNIRVKFPELFYAVRGIYYLFIKLLTGKSQTQLVFKKIFETNNWGDSESLSGPGSNLKKYGKFKERITFCCS